MRGNGKGRLTLVLALALVMGMGHWPIVALAQSNQNDAARFAEIMAEREKFPSLESPLAGEIVLQAGSPTLTERTTGPDVENFVATVTFQEPEGLALFDIWEMGFTFRGSDHFYVDSLGFWYYAPAGEGAAANGNIPDFFDLKTDGAVTLDLVVEDTRAMFGLGGTFVAAFAIPTGAASFVAVSSGFYPDYQVPGRAIPYSGFQVWALPGSDSGHAPTPSPVAIEPGSADYFATLLAAQQETAPLAGPFNANVKEEEGQLGLSWAGVDVADFHASAVVGVPEEESETGWAAGFVFRSTPTDDIRIGVSSLQQWYLSIGAGAPALAGEAPQLALLPGGANALDLFVQGQTAWLGINGDLAAIIELPAESTTGDVGVASGLYVDLSIPGRVTPFRDFAVLPLPPDAFLAETAPPADLDEGRFLELLAESNVVAPAVGPFAGRLVETTAGSAPTAVAGISSTDFGAIATFVNPADPAAGPWDSGFQFRGDDETANRIVIDSLGDVYAVLPGQGPLLVTRASTYDARPGNTNTLQLFVEGERALFGVNGQLVATIDLPPGAAGDVLVGAAFFNEDFVAGRVIEYQQFQVWGID